MHRESPAVQHLPIHLPNEHYVNFYAHQTVNEVLARQNVEKTQLTAWLDYIIMVWALPTGSSLSTIPGMLKLNHASKTVGQGDWEDVLCVTIKGRAVLFTTSFDYI